MSQQQGALSPGSSTLSQAVIKYSARNHKVGWGFSDLLRSNFSKVKIIEDFDLSSQFQTKTNIEKKGFPDIWIACFFIFSGHLYPIWENQTCLLRVQRFCSISPYPCSPGWGAVPIPARHSPATPEENPSPWGSLRPFYMVPATAWRKLSGRGRETLYPAAYCTVKYELANTGLAPTTQLVIAGLQKDARISIPIHGAKLS